MIVILSGGTASGKTRIRHELKKLGIASVVSYTTRPMRDGEEDGVTYHFITEDEFHTLERMNYFIECTSYSVSSNDTWYYGTAADDLDSADAVLIANPDGLKCYSQLDVNKLIIYLYADEDIIWNRLRERGDDSIEARRRIDADKHDFENIDKIADLSIRNDGQFTPKEIAELIYAMYEVRKNEQV